MIQKKRYGKGSVPVLTIALLVFMTIIPVIADDITAGATDSQEIKEDTNASKNTDIMILEGGWNFVSVPKRLASGENTAAIFHMLNSDGRSIWAYESDDTTFGAWKTLKESDKISPLNGYWVYSAKPATITLSYSNDPLSTPPLRDLKPGWNAIGFASITPATARDALLSAKKSWIEIIGFDAKTQSSLPAILNGGDGEHSDKTYLTPMQGYWCLVNESCMYAALTA
ncbi:MAG: hypothetical protein JXA44_12685 [Methanospirillaceae archaeon]|nr:hypothetical protein [Methanospirillaceae archaeon]